MIKAKLCHLFWTLPLAALCLSPLRIQAQQDVESTGYPFELKSGNPSSLYLDEALPEAAQKLISQLIENPYEEISQIRARQFIERLQMMQDDYTRSNRLDEASAIRNAINELKSRSSGVLPDPGNLTAYRGQNSRSINFEVVGRKTASVWGSGVYTDDSDLGTAAVHAGVLRPGQQASFV